VPDRDGDVPHESPNRGPPNRDLHSACRSTTGLATAADATILERAHAEGRIVVTADLDYPRLLAAQRSPTPGVILFRGGSLTDGEMLRMLDGVPAQLGAERIHGAITVVERARVRWRRLPIDP
jgi:predicted nuclease of predicted toxin-antitoxin system